MLILLAAILLLAGGMKERVFGPRELTKDRPPDPAAAIPISAPAAYLSVLAPGNRLDGESPPGGWSHLVLKSIPWLATGDLDTVSEQAFETARKVRVAIVADVRRSPSGPAAYILDRVGVGLCAPAEDGCGDVVVSPTSLDGSKRPWTAKQRVVLAAASLELARARLAAATPTFALIRTPATFLASGSHRKVDICYAVLAEPRSGELRTLAWPEDPQAGPALPSVRLLTSNVFDCPMDIKARRVLGNIPIAWSFAMRELPLGTPLAIPEHLARLLLSSSPNPEHSAELEGGLVRLLQGAP
jgi:hypothetical protein